MWVVIETKNHKRYIKVFKRKFIRYGIFLLTNKIKGNKVAVVYENDNVDKTFNIITSLCIALIVILLGLFIYTCLCFIQFNKCRSIDFNSNSCEGWRDF